MTDSGVGHITDITFAVPFKSYFAVVSSGGAVVVGPLDDSGSANFNPSGNQIERLDLRTTGGSAADYSFHFACFGELENE